jgi:hypothetical protein
MNGCYIDVPNLELPWSAEDILSEEDFELVHAKNGALRDLTIQSKNIIWTNAGKQRYDLLAGGNPQNLAQEEIDRILAEQSYFNGTGIVHDQTLKREMWEWLNDTFHKDYVDNLWTGPNGHSKIVPVTVLCFNKTSGWHCEGPIETPHFVPNTFDVTRINKSRPPAVCNFRLLGDVENSKIEFAECSESLEMIHNLARDKFFADWIATNVDPECQYESPIVSNILPSISIVNNIRVGPVSSYILDIGAWKNHINKIDCHEGMHNPYFVNVSKWHRVLTNNTPRVTFRVHASKNITFNKIEELIESETFFK